MSFAPFVIVTATTESVHGTPSLRLNQAYADALVDAGLVPLVLPPVDPALAVAALRDVAGLVLTGGEDVDPALYGEERRPETGHVHAQRDAYEIALARSAYERRVPTLAICRGTQLLNVALGGTLVQDIPAQRPDALLHEMGDAERRVKRVHGVTVTADSNMAHILGGTSIATNSSHHQAIDRLAPDLRITARADDGIIEGFESVDQAWWMAAVQWHPEELTHTAEPWDRRLFHAFADAVREFARD